MTAWTPEDLDRIGDAGEIEIIAPGTAGSATTTTIWVVRVGDDLLVRSWNGPDGGWYRRARQGDVDRIVVDGRQYDVAFDASEADRRQIDDAYRGKYGENFYARAMTGAGPASTTLRILRRQAEPRR